MLLRFACSNYRSIKDRQEISFVAAPAYKDHADSLFTFENIKHSVLPVAAIYGANASGKTNVLSAIGFMLRCIANSQSGWKPSQPIPRRSFRLDADSEDQPSSFEIDFVYAGALYEYGFECTSKKFTKEWLNSYTGSRKKSLFLRDENANVKFGSSFLGNKAVISQILRENTLVMSAGSVTGHKTITSLATHLVINTTYCDADSGPERTIVWAAIGSCVEAATALVREADTGINNIEIVAEESENKNDLKPFSPEAETIFYHPDQYSPDLVERAAALSGKELSVEFFHKRNDGEKVKFEPSEESRGTLRLFELAGPVQQTLRAGKTIVVDELDASLHTHLAQALIRLFTNRDTNPKGAQLLFTTHDTNLLNTELLRRDEIWFTEKGPDGATVLYPLSDIRVRATDNLAKGYLDGRFGAVPFIGNLERMAGKDC